MALAALLAFTMVGCGGSKNNSKNNSDSAKESKEKITYVSKGNPVTDNKIFGDNVYVFDSKDKIEDAQNKIDSVYKKQESNQFGDERYALLFKSGKYDKSLSVKVGFYTQVSGLGIEPTDTNINQLWVDAKWMGTNAGQVAVLLQTANLTGQFLQVHSSSIYVEIISGTTGKTVFGTWFL